MRNLWQHLKAAWHYGTVFPYVEAADTEEFWNKDDAIALNLFFQSYTGKKLKVRLTNYITKMALAAVHNPNCSPYMNGQASGVAACVAAIEAHFPQQEPEETTESEAVLETVEA